MYLPNGELSRAVLIGTSDFQNPDLPQLPAVNANLFALSRALTDPETGILPEHNCEIVQSPDSPDSFMRRLRRSANEAEDLLLVYYVGHGLRHQRRDDLYLTVRQTNPDGLDWTAVEYEWVRDVIADSPAKTRLLILDCCYSGLALDRMSGTAVDARELAVTGTSVMASSPKNKQSHSPKGERHTAFTSELLKLLADGSPVADTPLTVQNAYQSIKAGLAKRNFPLPTLRSDDTSGQMLLRRQPKPPKPVAPPVQGLFGMSPREAREMVRQVAQPAPPSQAEPPARPSPVDEAAVPTRVEQTVRIPPVRSPAPPRPVQHRSTPRSAELLGRTRALLRKISRSWLGLLWLAASVSLAPTIGGLAGGLFGPASTKAGDLSVFFGGLVFDVLVFVLLAVRWDRARRHDGKVALLPAFTKVPQVVLIVLTFGCVLIAVGLVATGPSRTTRTATSTTSDRSYSDLGSTVGPAAMVLAWGALFGQAVVRRRIDAKKLADQPPAGDQGQVKSGE